MCGWIRTVESAFQQVVTAQEVRKGVVEESNRLSGAYRREKLPIDGTARIERSGGLARQCSCGSCDLLGEQQRGLDRGEAV